MHKRFACKRVRRTAVRRGPNAREAKKHTEKFPVMTRLWETHIPIPNMNVKTKTAEGTWRATARENRWLPGYQQRSERPEDLAVQRHGWVFWEVGDLRKKEVLYRVITFYYVRFIIK